MGFGLGVRFMGAVLLGLALASVTAPALGCGLSVSTSGWQNDRIVTGPANGVIPVVLVCESSCSPVPAADELELFDQSRRKVPGSVVMSRQAEGTEITLVFKPDAEPTPGKYSLKLPGVTFHFPDVEVSEPISWSNEPEVFEALSAVEYSSGTAACCEGNSNSCIPGHCVFPELERATEVNIGWLSALSNEHDQYASRLITSAAPDPAWQFGNNARWVFQESFCYTLELKRLVDGVVHHYDERCVQRPADFTELGAFPQDPGAIANELRMCPSPPKGHEAAWCDAMKHSCEPVQQVFGCIAYAQVCEPSTGATGSGGAANNGGAASGGKAASGGASALPGDAGAANEDQDRHRLASTCSYTPHGKRPAQAAFGLIALGGVLLGMRRRRARHCAR